MRSLGILPPLVAIIAACFVVGSSPVSAQVFGLSGVKPDGLTYQDIVGVRFRFKILENEENFAILFGSNRFFTPGAPLTYLLETNVYSNRVDITHDRCTDGTQPSNGSFLKGSLRVSVPEYNFESGATTEITTGLVTSDIAQAPVETFRIDNIPDLWKTEAITQFDIDGQAVSVSIERGGLVDDVSAYRRCDLPLNESVTYREWVVTSEFENGLSLRQSVIFPDSTGGRYISSLDLLMFYSEFLNTEGAFRVQYWDQEIIRESTSSWQPVTEFRTFGNYDGDGSNFGIRRVLDDGFVKIEFSNLPGNQYLAANVPFDLDPTGLAGLVCDEGQKLITQNVLVSRGANDLNTINIYDAQTDQEFTLVPGGAGELLLIQNTWNVGDESTGYFNFDVNTGSFTDTMSDVEFNGWNGNEAQFQFCADQDMTSTTVQAIFGNTGGFTGIQTGVGVPVGDMYETTVNAATADWFKKFNEGRERSGAQVLQNIVELATGTGIERTTVELGVIALNEIYADQLIAGQLPAVGENIDVRGGTIFYEDTENNNLCLGSNVTGFSADGNQLQKDPEGCVGNIESYSIWKARVNGEWKTGTIENGDLGDVTASCENEQLSINYTGTPLNARITVTQGGQTTVYNGPVNETVLSCAADFYYLVESIGMGEGLYKVEGELSGVD